MRGAARVSVNNGGTLNAASRGLRPRSRGLHRVASRRKSVSAVKSNGGGNSFRRGSGGCARRESPERVVTLDVVAGWNKPASSYAEKDVGRLRKPEDGT